MNSVIKYNGSLAMLVGVLMTVEHDETPETFMRQH